MRGALLRKYSDNLGQLEVILKLQEQLIRTCAIQPPSEGSNLEPIQKFIALTDAAMDEIRHSPSWKIFLKYPRYWYLAETHARYFAPAEAQLREAVNELDQAAAP